MYNVSDILRYGAAPNPRSNATVLEAQGLAAWLKALGMPVGEICVNPVGLFQAKLIPLNEIEGDLPVDFPLHLQLEINGSFANVQLTRREVKLNGVKGGFESICGLHGFVFDPMKSAAVKAVVDAKIAELWKELES